MVKYQLTYKDVLGNDYVCNISNDAYTGEIVEIQGYCVLDYPKTDNIYDVIRGSGMRLTLEANQSLTLEDLYSDGEKENSVVLTRNTEVIFRGFIDPAGLFEDLVNEVWEMTIDCVDGLALLENLSYVDEEGNPFFGKLSDIQTITNCLRRTGVLLEDDTQLTVTSSIWTKYEGLPLTSCPLANTYSNQDRFYKDDGETIMSCKEVLESTLRKYGGCIIQQGGNWHIFSFYELLAVDRLFYTYKDGTFVSSETTNYPTQAIGTQINGAFPHWAGGNQRKEIVPPIGAVKVNYQYGFVKSLTENPYLLHDNTVIFDWTILNSTNLTLNADGSGITMTSSATPDLMIQSSSFDLGQNDIVTIRFAYRNTELLSEYLMQFKFKVIATSTSQTYYYTSNNTWSTTDQFYTLTNLVLPKGSQNVQNFDLAPLPDDVTVYMILVRPETRDIFGASQPANISYSEISMFPKTDENIQGESHTQQVAGKNTRIEEVIEVSVGDNPSDIYLGALYESDTTTNTEFWRTIYDPLDIANFQSLLEILSRFIARHRRDITYLVSGDVFGYFLPLQLFTLDLVPNKIFIMKSYSFDTKTAVNNCEFVELKRGGTFGLSYEFALDYGNVVEPTIVG